MISISRIKLKNFKSFKYVDVPLPRAYICLAGPNGSGKSNLSDGIRFVLGETALKSLRAKKVRDLIMAGARTAEVTITFEGESNNGKTEKYEIKRAIREDGKILYKLNGVKTTRTAILDAMKKYNLDESGRNIIAQGEVQRIISMSSKERRTIIDSVAGISDFEDKKKEAMKELDVVDGRIKETNLVLGERRAFLAELERERETALKYIDAKKQLADSKATLLHTEAEKLEKELKDVTELQGKLEFNISRKEEELKEMEKKIGEVETKRQTFGKELQLKQQTSALVKRIEELKASSASKEQLIADKEAEITKNENEYSMLAKEIANESEQLVDIEKEIEQLRKELPRIDESAQTSQKNSAANALKLSIREEEQKLQSLREAGIKTEMEAKNAEEVIEIKSAELERASPSISKEETDNSKEIARVKRDISGAIKELEEAFSRTKKLNTEIGESDKALLELKEKTAYMRVRVSPALANPALRFIDELRQKNAIQGIYGTVAEIIKFENKYATAVESSAGARLLYVVVEDADTATKIIERLKKANAGRATFIPLKEVRTSSGMQVKGAKMITEFIEYDPIAKKAVDFVFGDTVLVQNASEAKSMGIGNVRMVTLEGEIFERTGIISGGKSESSILAAAQLRKSDEEIEQIKRGKEEMVKELFAIREHESELRSFKSSCEVKLKALEMQNAAKEEQIKNMEAEEKRRQQLAKEIEEYKNSVKQKLQETEKIRQEIEKLQLKISAAYQELAKVEAKEKELSEEAQRKQTEFVAKISSIRATLNGKQQELALRKKEIHAKQERLKAIDKEKKEALDKISSLKRQSISDKKELEEQEAKIATYSKEIEKIFENMKKTDEELQILGKQRGEKRIEIDKFNKELNQSNIKKATAETRFTDIKAEMANYKEFEFLKASREELSRMVKEAEGILSSLGNVNMAAIEMFEKKKAEIIEIEERINKLTEEREAVITMINEIDTHKKEAFFETFHAVNENFKRMFRHINIGEGYLYLDKPNEPFESGMFIKLKRNNREHVLDSLSGGESSLVALMFIFALQFFKPSPFYILDEVDAALDKENSRNLAELIKQMSADTQFIMVSHNDAVMSNAQAVLGVTKVDGVSKLVGVKLESLNAPVGA